jgi:transposase
MLRIVYHLLIDQHPYEDLGEVYFDNRQKHELSRCLVRRLQRLGYAVQLEPIGSAA